MRLITKSNDVIITVAKANIIVAFPSLYFPITLSFLVRSTKGIIIKANRVVKKVLGE